MPLLDAGDDYLTPAEAAGILGVSPKTVSRWADAGLLRCIVTLGGHRRFEPGVIQEVAAQMGVQGSTEEKGGDRR
jgi:excisionase family DNA binding protein